MSGDKLTGKVVKSTGSWYNVLCGDSFYKCIIRGKLRTEGFKSTNPVAVGDNVNFFIQDNNMGVITGIVERKNCIVRQSTNLSKKMHLIACNVDQAAIIVSLNSPATPIEFIDRFLVSSEAYQIPAIIIFNKLDLYTEENIAQLQELVEIYENIGYKCIPISVKDNLNIKAVKNSLLDKTTVVAGNSGVGKSSLINLMSPDYNLKVSDISEKYKTGKHTTTFAEMFELEFGGFVVDTPGIRAFGVSFLEKEDIAHNFPEMFGLLDKCKYYNCKHIDEPDCAVKDAFENGEIAYSRYRSYLNIMLEDDEKHRKDIYS
ncbi:MAG: ribosome small subunit-dependent GTPase A [Bacteroidales bacterium]|nr:ribosome small subunit-dependent GTPase A [Bacteroidales bacterium]